MNFRTFLEEDEEWSKEDVLDRNREINSAVKEPFDPPEYADPDDLYNGKNGFRGGFSFTFSNRLVRKDSRYVKEGLVIDSPFKAHKYMVRTNHAKDNTKPILSGRYGTYKTTPIVTIWHRTPDITESLKALWELVHPESFLYINGENVGKVREKLFGKIPERKKAQIEQRVKIGGREYAMYEIPAKLHSLPSNSPEHAEIRDFICKNHETYPILKNFLSRAKCQDQTRPEREPESIRRRSYWNTSESHVFDLFSPEARSVMDKASEIIPDLNKKMDAPTKKIGEFQDPFSDKKVIVMAVDASEWNERKYSGQGAFGIDDNGQPWILFRIPMISMDTISHEFVHAFDPKLRKQYGKHRLGNNEPYEKEAYSTGHINQINKELKGMSPEKRTELLGDLAAWLRQPNEDMPKLLRGMAIDHFRRDPVWWKRFLSRLYNDVLLPNKVMTGRRMPEEPEKFGWGY